MIVFMAHQLGMFVGTNMFLATGAAADYVFPYKPILRIRRR